MREGHRRARGAPPLAMEEGLALGVEGRRGLVAERQASRRRPLGLGLEPQSGWGTLVPRPCARRQARATWGPPPLAWPRCGEQPGRPQAEAPRRWPGHSVIRQGEVEARETQGVQAEVRVVVVQARPLAPPQAPASAAAPGQAAEAGADHGRQGPTRWFACRPAAEAASAE